MSPRHVVVDGSNIATEGRSLPSLAQLDVAVTEFRREHPDDVITVVVDATFGHRIDEAEVEAFKDAEAHNEVVSPPAGAIGRGDAFLLRIAEKVGATVLSNDSFQEFHGEHEWLFDKGRLIGGKPVPGVGWIFTPRTPVRGPKSREAVKVAKRAKKAEVAPEFPTLEEEVAARRARGGRPAKAKAPAAPKVPKVPAKVSKAIALATEEAVEPDSDSVRRRRRRRGGAPPAEPVNPPLTFINFVSDHRLGSEVAGEVDHFSSHGAFVRVDDAECYIPLSAMGDPAPRAARDVLKRGETRTFVIQAFDPPRRGIELALPGFAHVAAAPTEETVEDEIAEGTHVLAPEPAPAKAAKKARAPRAKKAAAVAAAAAEPAPAPAPAPAPTLGAATAPVKKAAKKKAASAPAKKAAEVAKAAAKKEVAGAPEKAAGAPAKKTAAATKRAAAAKKAAVPKKAAAAEPTREPRAGRARTGRAAAPAEEPRAAAGPPETARAGGPSNEAGAPRAKKAEQPGKAPVQQAAAPKQAAAKKTAASGAKQAAPARQAASTRKRAAPAKKAAPPRNA